MKINSNYFSWFVANFVVYSSGICYNNVKFWRRSEADAGDGIWTGE